MSTNGTDNISNPVVCTADQLQTDETTGASFTGSCTNDAGLASDAAPLTVKVDKTAPSATLAATGERGRERLVHEQRDHPDNGCRHDQRTGHVHPGPVTDERDDRARIQRLVHQRGRD